MRFDATRALIVYSGVLTAAFVWVLATGFHVEAFRAIIDQQRSSGVEAGDHFARPGSNDRIWEALGKLALHDPDTFVDYYSNASLARVLPCSQSPVIVAARDSSILSRPSSSPSSSTSW